MKDPRAPLLIPMQTGRGQNSRGHWRVAHKRNLAEQEVVLWELARVTKPEIPCSCILTRVAPSRGLDDDNLAGSLKNVRDAVAKWLGVDDGKRETVRYRYSQRRGPWAVQIEFAEPMRGAQFILDLETL